MLSATEVLNYSSDMAYDVSRQLDYYSSTGAALYGGSDSPVKDYNGNPHSWSTRTINCRTTGIEHYVYVWETGCWGNENSDSDGISPAFRIG